MTSRFAEIDDESDIIQMYKTIDKYSDKELLNKYSLGFWFEQNSDNSSLSNDHKDVNMNGLYTNNRFFECIESPRNLYALFDDSFFIDIMLASRGRTYYKTYQSMKKIIKPSVTEGEKLPLILMNYSPYRRPDPIP